MKMIREGLERTIFVRKKLNFIFHVFLFKCRFYEIKIMLKKYKFHVVGKLKRN